MGLKYTLKQQNFINTSLQENESLTIVLHHWKHLQIYYNDSFALFFHRRWMIS